ncbi:3-isopropylmalate dehydrogenase [Rubricella aquisinus]|uniref:3-isopropylmalate dehydrogenase n=1 Tax=Rubricella aquisinus TaxID=2028108 RepID=A0A840WN55_9RHOB|nr:isocitrate/isopropylmalate family dehydrogenase [Rubricella aquisinus]MBB5515092.1 3-isopropylmalate dehydrogenase [Rubricella aquisinus]
MSPHLKIAVFDGDGIGPEIMTPTLALLEQVTQGIATLDFTHLPAGAGHYRDHGDALPQSSLDAARASDAILLSAMGLPSVRYEDGTEITPQIDLRIALDLYAGVRPVRIVPGQPSPLKITEPVDFVLIRESTEGLFHTLGKGLVTEDYAEETLRITRATSHKLFAFAFRMAARRKALGKGPGRVTLVDKANVFRAFAYMRRLFDEAALGHPDIATDHAYVDAMALFMVTRPQAWDVMVTENMFGDILSDLGAGIMGGLGLAPSADIGDDNAVFQPCHGSAPDIAGQGIANPLAMILSGAMMLDWLAERHEMPALAAAGARLDAAVWQVVSTGTALTRDIGGTATTQDAANAVKSAL